MQQRLFPSKQEPAEKVESKHKNLEPAFYAKSPPFINLADSPSAMASSDGIKKMSPDEFAETIGFQWTNSILIDSQNRDELWQEKTSPHFATTEIEYRLHHPLESLVICPMKDKINEEEERSLGHGVFLAPDAEAILPGTVLDIYAGKMKTFEPGKTNGYEMSPGYEETKDSVLIRKYEGQPLVDALPCGNIMRFMQDLPGEEELESRYESPLDLSNIMTANVMAWPVLYYGVPVTLLIAGRMIYPGEQLGFPYEGNYWLNRQPRCLFNKAGDVIGYMSFDKMISFKDSFKASQDQQVGKVDAEYIRPRLQKLLLSPSLDAFDYKERFSANVNEALRIFLNRYREEEETRQFLEKIQANFTQAQSSDEAYKKLFALNSIQDPKIKEDLLNLKKELFFHMTKYNEGKKMHSESKEPSLGQRPARGF